MEIEILVPQLEHLRTKEIKGRTFNIGKLAGRRVVVVYSGNAKVNAAQTTQLLFDNFKISHVIFTGVAGGVAPEIKLVDVVISEKLYQHDHIIIYDDDQTKSNYIWMGNPDVYTEEGVYQPEWFIPDLELVNLTVSALEAVKLPLIPEELAECIGIEPYSPDITTGTMVTGDQLIFSSKEKQWIYETFDADVAEMQGSAVAQVCESNMVPYIMLRSVSDFAEPDPACVLDLFMPYAAETSASLVPIILEAMPK